MELLRQITKWSLLRRAVGLVFLISGFSKSLHPETLQATAEFYHLDSQWLPIVTGLAVIIETFIGQALVLRPIGGIARYAATLLFIFSIHLSLILSSNNPPSCGCPGVAMVFQDSRSQAIFGIVRNATMMLVLVPSFSISAYRT